MTPFGQWAIQRHTARNPRGDFIRFARIDGDIRRSDFASETALVLYLTNKEASSSVINDGIELMREYNEDRNE
jgi:hypothetical protein